MEEEKRKRKKKIEGEIEKGRDGGSICCPNSS